MRLCPLKTPKQPAELRRVAVTPAGESGRRHTPCRFSRPRFSLLTSSHPGGRGSVAILVCGCSSMSEAYWRRVLRQDEWRADSLGSMGKNDPCPLKRNASGNWGSRGTPLAGSRGWPRVEGLGREASLPSLAFWELFLHRKSSPRGVGNGVSPHTGGPGVARPRERAARRRPKGAFPKKPPIPTRPREPLRRGLSLPGGGPADRWTPGNPGG